jgi:hypothetical protein
MGVDAGTDEGTGTPTATTGRTGGVTDRVGALVDRLTVGRTGSALTVVLVGVTAGCWVGYALVYSLSGLWLPQYTLVVVVVLGFYVDYLAESMLDRVVTLLGSALVAYLTGFGVFTLPALVGWYTDPVLRRALYLSGLKRTFVVWGAGFVLLVAGTFVSYILRGTYAEVTR